MANALEPYLNDDPGPSGMVRDPDGVFRVRIDGDPLPNRLERRMLPDGADNAAPVDLQQSPAGLIEALGQMIRNLGKSTPPISDVVEGLAGAPAAATQAWQDPTKSRNQLWPERMIRSGLTLPGDVASGRVSPWAMDPQTGEFRPNPEIIERAMDTAGLMGGGSIPGIVARGAEKNALGIVPVARAKAINMPVNVPQHPEFLRAIEGTPGAQITPDGVQIRVGRAQNTKAAGNDSNTGSVFYSPVAVEKGYLSKGNKTSGAPGGPVAVEGETLYKNPLSVRSTATFAAPEILKAAGVDFRGPYSIVSNLMNLTRDEATGAWTRAKFDRVVDNYVAKYAPDLAPGVVERIKSMGPGDRRTAGIMYDAAAMTAARKAGHDGVLIHDGKKVTEVSDLRESHYPGPDGSYRLHPQFLSDTALPAAPLSGLKPAPTFYSALKHATTGAPQATMSPQQWLGYLKNQPGVKAEELAWTGIGDWLGAQKGKVKKEDVQAYLNEHKVEIKDVTKSGKQASDLITDDVHDLGVQAVLDAFLTENPKWVGKEHTAAFERAHERFAESPRGEEIYNNAQQQVLEPEGAVKYSSYQLPGGENYREHLLTLPDGRTAGPKTFADWAAQNGKQDGPIARAEYNEWNANNRGITGGGNYKSSHWDEPNVLAHVRTNDRFMPANKPDAERAAAWADTMTEFRAKYNEIDSNLRGTPDYPANVQHDPRVKALNREYGVPENATPGQLEAWEAGGGNGTQFRLRNRTSGNTTKPFDTKAAAEAHLQSLLEKLRPNLEIVGVPGEPPKPVKSLHIEEIQSDWHQEGRKKGYKQTFKPEDAKERIGPAGDKQYYMELPSENGGRTQHYETREEAARAAERAVSLGGQPPVPDAPFKTTWPELALKRMIRHAAENGYDRISWTPGEAQAARYDLSKSIDTLHAKKNADGTYVLYGELPNGRDLHKFGDKIPAEKMEDFVGKDIARKILESKEDKVELTGPDLKVGGEGMREFYDKMLPKMAEKIGKAHGVKVKTGQLPGSAEAPRTPRQVYDILTEQDPKLKEQFPAIKDFVDYWNDLAGDKRAELTNKAQQHGTTPVHYFDLPPSLREHAIGKGFPLYMSSIPFPLQPVDDNPWKKDKK